MSEFVLIPEGSFLFGSEDHYPEEGPVREVSVEPFLLSETTVTNAEFEDFVEDTGYKSVAERSLDPEVYSGQEAPGSIVFRKSKQPLDLQRPDLWWKWVQGASWRHPLGPGSGIRGRGQYPVVQVCYEDALAYAAWAGGRLPSEEEWERAARGNLVGNDYPLGSRAGINHWIGTFPYSWKRTPGRPSRPGPCPVKTFPPTPWGLYEMCGNVWEWTSSLYIDKVDKEGGQGSSPCCRQKEESVFKDSAAGIPRHVLRGGSFLCADNYCRRYRVSARIPQDIESATNHIGFRLARDVDK